MTNNQIQNLVERIARLEEQKKEIAADVLLPYPPSVNRLWRVSKSRVHKSPQYQAWLISAGNSLNGQCRRSISGEYNIHILACAPDRRKRDLGNIEKALSDLLVKHGVVDDDHLCQKQTIEWATNLPSGSVRILIERHGRD